MNCRQAREIMNSVFDGVDHPQEAVARDHIHMCAECREWLAGMERVVCLAESARDALPQVDIAASVMARLPERHPASVEVRKVWISRRALAWMGAGWLVGLALMVVFGLWAVRWAATPSAGEHIVRAYTITRAFTSSAGASFAGLKPIANVLGEATKSFRPHALNLVSGLVVLDCIVLALGYAIWRKRIRLPGAMFVLN